MPPTGSGTPSTERLVIAAIAVVIIGVLVWQFVPHSGGGLNVEGVGELSEGASGAARDSSLERTCYANQRTIEGAVQQYLASSPDVAMPTSVSDLVPDYIKTEPECPSTDEGYELDGSRVVACSEHGHF